MSKWYLVDDCDAWEVHYMDDDGRLCEAITCWQPAPHEAQYGDAHDLASRIAAYLNQSEGKDDKVDC